MTKFVKISKKNFLVNYCFDGKITVTISESFKVKQINFL